MYFRKAICMTSVVEQVDGVTLWCTVGHWVVAEQVIVVTVNDVG